MLFQETIARKRDGRALTKTEIDHFVHQYTRDRLPDYQASALLMAIYLRGMDARETAELTAAMAHSGQQLNLAEWESVRPTLDKHSTGGVGDKTSLIVVPILAAAGAAVCKMSGRGLGHTGGTLDKLEAIPGFRVALSADEMRAQVRDVGACLCGQTADLAPADRKLYALRDATATVGSLPLIVSSILSKKLAGGARRFLFDVKVGGGALMPTLETAQPLAQALVEGARAQGRRAVALLSDMSQPLGKTIGNALEVAEAIELLDPARADRADERLRELCLLLAAEGIELCGLGRVADGSARARAAAQLASGAALGVFRAIVEQQDGDPAFVDHPERLPAAPAVQTVTAPAEGGWVRAIDAAALGTAVVRMGGGRARKEDRIDPRVGIVLKAAVGQAVGAGEPIAEVHAANAADADRVAAEVRAAYAFSLKEVDKPALVLGRIGE